MYKTLSSESSIWKKLKNLGYCYYPLIREEKVEFKRISNYLKAAQQIMETAKIWIQMLYLQSPWAYVQEQPSMRHQWVLVGQQPVAEHESHRRIMSYSKVRWCQRFKSSVKEAPFLSGRDPSEKKLWTETRFLLCKTQAKCWKCFKKLWTNSLIEGIIFHLKQTEVTLHDSQLLTDTSILYSYRARYFIILYFIESLSKLHGVEH